MNGIIYKVYVVFTKKKICGGKKEEQMFFVHVLPIAFDLSLLLADVLAKHFLIEFASQWFADILKKIWNDQKTVDVRNDIHTLLKIGQLDNDTIADLMRLPASCQIM